MKTSAKVPTNSATKWRTGSFMLIFLDRLGRRPS
jgi:hypothetical protein